MQTNKTLCVTIDVEPDCDIHWNRSSPLVFDSVLHGIPAILRPLWNKYGIKPVYFVSPEVVQNEKCCRILKNELKYGAEIAAHLHSEYMEPQKKYEDFAGTPSKEYPCNAYSTEIEFAKIENLTKLIESRIGVRPVTYRAARYGADLDTIKSLANLGYLVDSSVTPEVDWSRQGGPDHSKAPNQPYFVSETDFYSPGDLKILEIPITVSKKRLPFLPDKWWYYRWLRPTLMSLYEMKALAREFTRNYDRPVLTMMFHSMEILPGKTPYVRGRFSQWLYLRRLRGIIKYLRQKGFTGKTCRQIYDEKLR